MKKIFKNILLFFFVSIFLCTTDFSWLVWLFEKLKSLNFKDIIYLSVNSILAIITFCYLMETRFLRKDTQYSNKIQNSPIIYYDDLRPSYSCDEEKNEVYMRLALRIINKGRCEGKDVRIKSVWLYKDDSFENEEITIQYIFPEQSYDLLIRQLRLELGQNEIDEIKKQLKETGQFRMPKSVQDDLKLVLLLSYKDQYEEIQNYNWTQTFNWDLATWVHSI